MNTPTREECFKLWDKYEMFKEIRAHSLTVEKVAMFLAKKLKERGEKVNLDLVGKAALLHDIGKTTEIKTSRSGGKHGEIGYDILAKEGYPEIAEITRKHIMSYLLKRDFKNWSWEEKIVQYADDRVNHHEIVTLKERFDYIFKRYGTASKEVYEMLKKIEPLAYELEKEIFEKIGMEPDAILSLK